MYKNNFQNFLRNSLKFRARNNLRIFPRNIAVGVTDDFQVVSEKIAVGPAISES